MVDELVIEAGDGTRLGAVRAGGDPVTLVFLHAGVSDRRSWLPVMDLLADRYGSMRSTVPGSGRRLRPRRRTTRSSTSTR